MKLISAVIATLAGYAVISIGIPFLGSQIHPGTWPVVPASLMKIYMFFVVCGVFMVFTFTEERKEELMAPIRAIYGKPSLGLVRLVVILLVAAAGAGITYQNIKPSFEAPVELRSIHPAPPSTIKAYNKTYNLLTLTNPYRDDKENFAENVKQGGVVYYKNCFYCHGDKMLGKGHYYHGFFPMPANFQDVGTIAMLQESFLFWRISTGGPGLPKEGAPWVSAMPVWKDFLSEEEIWKVILFLYDYTGHTPRTF